VLLIRAQHAEAQATDWRRPDDTNLRVLQSDQSRCNAGTGPSRGDRSGEIKAYSDSYSNNMFMATPAVDIRFEAGPTVPFDQQPTLLHQLDRAVQAIGMARTSIPVAGRFDHSCRLSRPGPELQWRARRNATSGYRKGISQDCEDPPCSPVMLLGCGSVIASVTPLKTGFVPFL